MNNNILHFYAVTQTFTSQLMQILRLQLAPAEPGPTCGGAGFLVVINLAPQGRKGCLALLICVHRCIGCAHGYKFRKLFLQVRKERCSEEYVMLQSEEQ